ncbi:sigma-54-dependent Fis family transcriptional regulator [Marinobacter arenosus]|uniref:sigma-54-dependent Fis family transcriptional regulator n=1 Tax=Marinobacter arenosus TaxID=2856822 RepID=UPI001C4CE49C|nr:sigma-54-dependent Fis family transcriptional regulator [Marinobacter arenosus]MBW0147850.1 sigma-54-dependent Fis family transcriptional regulator [Marinobacter arenosus]
MQTELHTGIDLAVELIQQETLPALLKTATAQLRKTFGLTRCWALELDLSGRTLHCDELPEQAEFDCNDFSHPFSHILQTGRARELSRAASYRLDHSGFQALFEASERPRSFWIEPLTGADGRMLGMLVLCRDESDWEGITAQPLFGGLRQLLAHQWVSQLQSRDQIWQRRLLKRSLDNLHDTETVRRHCERLSRTLVGNSVAMTQLRTQVVRAAGSMLSVLVQGETGCGKDVVARGIHELSDRADGPLVVVNCAAIPDTLLESELFGHTKGAFSGAYQSKDGLLAQADGGTLFLDEIGDMPMALQSKLLRVLESRQFRPLGARDERRSDFRLVAATHQPLQQRIEAGNFRRDLFYRLGQFPLRVTSLRERPEDLESLSRHFIHLYTEREGTGPLGISSHALHRLAGYDFPGNVRELRNIIELACLQTPAGDDIQPEVLRLEDPFGEPDLLGPTAVVEPKPMPGVPGSKDIRDLKSASQAFEAAVIRERLQQYGGNRAQAAESLGLPKRTLAHKCLKYRVNEL